MNQIVIDTNALLRFLLKDVPTQTVKVRNVLKKAKEGKTELLIPQIVIFEVVFALTKYYRFDKEKVIEGIESILGGTYFIVEDHALFAQTVERYKIHSLSFVDCFLASYAKQKGIAIFTFDKDLKKVVRKHR